jgi:hypothetical protein
MKPKNKKQTAGVQEAPELFTFDHKHKPVRVEMEDNNKLLKLLDTGEDLESAINKVLKS